MSFQEQIAWQRFLVLLLLALALLSLAWHRNEGALDGVLYATESRGDSASWCPLPDPAANPDDGLKDSSKLFPGDDILQLQVQRLASTVNISTVSYDDNVDVDEDQRWLPFGELHAQLEQLFPLVHTHLTLNKVNKYGLLYHLPGKEKTRKPVMFTAHQDVVPASNAATWNYLPFEAYFDGEWLWGRGASDGKSDLVGILTAMESLLEQGFQPERTIILSFGFDEETGGYRGAAHLSRYLEKKIGADSLAMIHDEGGMGVSRLGEVAYALPATAEKGFMDVVLTLETNGGHSSRPPNRTAIGIMSQIVLALEDHPFRPTLDDTNPVRSVLKCETKFSPDYVEPWLRRELESGRDIGERVVQSRGENIRWQIQTSQAVDIMRGGVKDNQLPEEVRTVINYRVLPHDGVEEILSGIASLLAPIAHEYGLAVTGFGFDEKGTEKGILRLESKDILLPSPITPTSPSSEMWDVFAGTLRHVFESTPTLSDIKTIVPVGSIATGNSDTAHYWTLTGNIFRFTPAREGTRLGVHATNERMEMSAHLEAIRVYYDLMRNVQKYQGQTCNTMCPSL